MGKSKGIPLMCRDFTYINGVEMEKAVELTRQFFFDAHEIKVIERDVKNKYDFKNVYEDWVKYLKYEKCLSDMHACTNNELFYYNGLCEVCNSPQPFAVNYKGAKLEGSNRDINWRESLVCPNCGCNSHERFIIDKIFSSYIVGQSILIYESCSKVFNRVKREIDSVCGFEYPGENYCGESEHNGIHCEDICKLSYEDNEFDLVVVNDTFVLTCDYRAAFAEVFRVLKPGGKMIFTVPFDGNSDKTVQRARNIDGKVIYEMGEWNYYNFVLPDTPRPVYQVFGWDILDILKECGFSDATGKAYYGLEKGYLGYLPLYFEASK